ncbi:T-complex protein 11-like protein 1 isoform X2 [Amia ocellicauda]
MPNRNEPRDRGDSAPDLPDLHPAEPPGGSTPQPSTLAEVMETVRNMSNLSIAHEIVVNRDFCFKQNSPPPDSLEGRVKEIVHRAFWDSLEAQLALSPPDYTHAISLLQEVKEMLLSLLLPAHVHVRAQVEEALDLALIRQQAERGALDLRRLSGFIINTMGSLCAPVRDPEIRKLRELEDTVPLLREILRVLDLMKVDMVNFTVQALRPRLLQQAVHYERTKFQEILEQRPDALYNTTAWLERAVQEARSGSAPPVPCPEKSPGQTPDAQGGGSACSPDAVSPTAVLNQAFLRLLHWDSDCLLYPETLMMDRSRLEELKLALEQLTLTASVLLVTSTHCGGVVFSGPGFVGKLKQVITALLEGSHSRSFNLQEALLEVGGQVQKLVNEAACDQGGAAMTPERETILRGQIRDVAQTHNPVRNLIASRIQNFMLSFLGSTSAQKGPVGTPVGLAPVGAELAEAGAAFGRIVHHNRLVFGPYYSAILKRALLPQGETETDIDSR